MRSASSRDAGRFRSPSISFSRSIRRRPATARRLPSRRAMRSSPRSAMTLLPPCRGIAYRRRDGEGRPQPEGLKAAADGAADLVVLNTCHIREKAAEKVYSEIGRLKREDGSRPMIAVAGCVAQAEGQEIARRAPSVGVVVGPQAYHRLPDLVARAAAGETAVDTDMPA